VRRVDDVNVAGCGVAGLDFVCGCSDTCTGRRGKRAPGTALDSKELVSIADQVRISHCICCHCGAWKIGRNVQLFVYPQARNGICVFIAEVFIERIFLARVSDVVFGMKATAQLSANIVTGFIPHRQVAANAPGHISLLLIDPKLFSSIQSTSTLLIWL
jgi:hypothetical protein